MLEKLGSDHRADGVASMVFGSALATPVAIEPRHGVSTARLQFSSYDISIDHGASIAEKLAMPSGLLNRGVTHLLLISSFYERNSDRPNM